MTASALPRTSRAAGRRIPATGPRLPSVALSLPRCELDPLRSCGEPLRGRTPQYPQGGEAQPDPHILPAQPLPPAEALHPGPSEGGQCRAAAPCDFLC